MHTSILWEKKIAPSQEQDGSLNMIDGEAPSDPHAKGGTYRSGTAYGTPVASHLLLSVLLRHSVNSSRWCSSRRRAGGAQDREWWGLLLLPPVRVGCTLMLLVAHTAVDPLLPRARLGGVRAARISRPSSRGQCRSSPTRT